MGTRAPVLDVGRAGFRRQIGVESTLFRVCDMPRRNASASRVAWPGGPCHVRLPATRRFIQPAQQQLEQPGRRQARPMDVDHFPPRTLRYRTWVCTARQAGFRARRWWTLALSTQGSRLLPCSDHAHSSVSMSTSRFSRK